MADLKKILKMDFNVFESENESIISSIGRYLSRTPQNGGLQSQLDSALNPQWGNTATTVTEVTIPKGTVIYEGTVGPQIITDSMGNRVGTLPEGENQIYILEVDTSWFGK